MFLELDDGNDNNYENCSDVLNVPAMLVEENAGNR